MTFHTRSCLNLRLCVLYRHGLYHNILWAIDRQFNRQGVTLVFRSGHEPVTQADFNYSITPDTIKITDAGKVDYRSPTTLRQPCERSSSGIGDRLFWFQDHVRGLEGSLDRCPVRWATLAGSDYAYAVQEVNKAIERAEPSCAAKVNVGDSSLLETNENLQN
jgi:hypothetical protein